MVPFFAPQGVFLFPPAGMLCFAALTLAAGVFTDFVHLRLPGTKTDQEIGSSKEIGSSSPSFPSPETENVYPCGCHITAMTLYFFSYAFIMGETKVLEFSYITKKNRMKNKYFFSVYH